MSQHNYAPSVPPELLEAWRQMVASPPEWSVGEQAYQPYDVGSAQAGLNLQQDTMTSMRDPFTSYLTGAYDPRMFGYDVEEVEKGSTEGYDMLFSVAKNSAGSAHGEIAQALLEGASPQEAMKLAADSFGDAMLDPTTKQIDKSYLDFANTSFTKLHSDKAAVTREVPTEALKMFLDAGLGDPREQFTPQLLDQNYDAYASGTEAAKRVTDAPNTKSMRPGARKPQQADVDATSAMKQMLGIGPAMAREERVSKRPTISTTTGKALRPLPANTALDPNSQLAARKDYMNVRNKSADAAADANWGAAAAAKAYGTPTMMLMAQKMGLIR